MTPLGKWSVTGTISSLLMLSSWWGYHRWDESRKPENILIEKMREKAKVTEEVPVAQRMEQFRQLREEMEKLTPEQRKKVWEEGQAIREAAMDARIKEYCSLPDVAAKKAFLDKDIDRMEAIRKEFMQRRTQRPPGEGTPPGTPPEGGASRGGPPGGPPGSGGSRTSGRSRGGNSGGSNSGGNASASTPGSPPAAGGPPGTPGTRSQDTREDRKRDRLDSTSPETRAQRIVYMQDMAERRKERGLPTFGFGPGSGRGR